MNTFKSTKEDFDVLTKVTNCPLCKLLKTHLNNRFLNQCDLAKKYGYTHPYDHTPDETSGDFKKRQAQHKQTADTNKKDADDLKKAENEKKAHAGCEKADAEKARLAAAAVTTGDTFVGKGGKDAITEKEKADATNTNFDS